MTRASAAVAERLWRVRKQHVWIDAQITDARDGRGVDLRFYYDARLVLARRWPTRALAVNAAGERLRELQRAGWNTHW
jgi:hypothetical protein